MTVTIRNNGTHLARGRLEKLANVLLALYAISIYIWSDNENMVRYSTLLCLAAMAIMLLVFLPERYFVIARPFAYLLIFNAICIVSILWASSVSKASTMALRTLPLLTLFALILFNYLDHIRNGKKVLISCIYIAGIALAVYTIYMQGGLGGYLAQLNSGNRVGGNVNNVNTIGLGTSISAIIAMYYIIFKRRRYDALALILCGFVALGTGSNKALVVMVLGCFLLLLFYAYVNNNVSAFFKAAGLTAAAICAFILLLQLPMFETINTRFTGMISAYLGSGEADHSAQIRNELVKAGLAQFVQTPLLGIGINNGSVVAMASVGYDYYLHNNYVELLVDVGAVGTFFFYAAVLSSLYKLAKSLRYCGAEAVVVIVVMLAWLVIQWGFVCYYSKIAYLYIVLAALFAWPAGEIAKKNAPAKAWSNALASRAMD